MEILLKFAQVQKMSDLSNAIDGFTDSGEQVGSRARDGTTYGRLRASPTSFFVHHTQRLSKAAACGNVDGIHKMIQAAKQSAAARARGAQERDA